jgi:hypothetical protein
MGDVVIDLSNADQEIFLFNASDEALEAAAAPIRDTAGAMTLAFCSGLDACPPKAPLFHSPVDPPL